MQREMVYSTEKVRKILPHRYPFIMIDRVLEYTRGDDPDSRVGCRAVGIKNVTSNENFFNGHFPTQPVMPGVLIIEAMAQIGGIACFREGEEGVHSLIIASVRKARFRQPVVPGDTLVLSGHVIRDRGRTVVLRCEAKVDGHLMAEAEIMGHISEIEGEKVF